MDPVYIFLICLYGVVVFLIMLTILMDSDGPDSDPCTCEFAWVPAAFSRELCLRPLLPLVVMAPALLWPVFVAAAIVVALGYILYGLVILVGMGFVGIYFAATKLCRVDESTTCCWRRVRKTKDHELEVRTTGPDVDVERGEVGGAQETQIKGSGTDVGAGEVAGPQGVVTEQPGLQPKPLVMPSVRAEVVKVESTPPEYRAPSWDSNESSPPRYSL